MTAATYSAHSPAKTPMSDTEVKALAQADVARALAEDLSLIHI